MMVKLHAWAKATKLHAWAWVHAGGLGHDLNRVLYDAPLGLKLASRFDHGG